MTCAAHAYIVRQRCRSAEELYAYTNLNPLIDTNDKAKHKASIWWRMPHCMDSLSFVRWTWPYALKWKCDVLPGRERVNEWITTITTTKYMLRVSWVFRSIRIDTAQRPIPFCVALTILCSLCITTVSIKRAVFFFFRCWLDWIEPQFDMTQSMRCVVHCLVNSV